MRGAPIVAFVVLAVGCSDPSSRSRDAAGGTGGGGGSGQGGTGGTGGQGAEDGQGGGGGGGALACGAGTTFGGAASPWKNPEIQCHWKTGRQVITTPLVIDLDGDRMPEIVFMSGPESCDTRDVRLHAIRGTNCQDVWAVSAPLDSCGELAAGDLDGDGRPEIVGFNGVSDTAYVFDAKGAMLASVGDVLGVTVGLGPMQRHVGLTVGPAIVEIDGALPAEIVVGAAVVKVTAGATWTLARAWRGADPGGYWGWLSIAADLDGDAVPEVIAGRHVFDGKTGADKTPSGLAMLGGGYPAVADLVASAAGPEIILASSEPYQHAVTAVNAMSGARVFGPIITPPTGGNSGGGPTVADFDGDGRPEVGVASLDTYSVYDPDCAATPMPTECKAPGVLWTSETQDITSGGTSSSVFDFNNDCQAEVVYRDECWLRIYDGKTGTVRAAFAVTSGTALEEPVIADVDGDGHAEIVVASDNKGDNPGTMYDICKGGPEVHTGSPWTGYTSGILVLRDPEDRWVGARPIWNQNSYHVTNVGDDGSIPVREAPSWQGANNYRQNVEP